MSAMTVSPAATVLGAGPVRGGLRPATSRPAAPRPATSRPAAARPAAAGPATIRLTRRGRLVLAAVALAVLGGGFGLGQAAADGPPAAIEVAAYTVVPGDTLWGIAAGVAAPGQDVRDVIATIQDLNNLDDSAIAAGAQLLLPAP